MSTPEISVVVPVYQVEAYLKRCIDSILRQTFTNFELILVDDGSTDASGVICDDYAQKDSRVRVIHQENAGCSAARNTGIDVAQGKYLSLIDSDDIMLSKDYLSLFYTTIKAYDAQAVCCSLSIFEDGFEPADLTVKKSEPAFVGTGVDYFYWNKLPNNFFKTSAHAKLYDIKLFADVRYPEGRVVEDQAVIHELMFPADKIVALDMPMYGYRLNRSGIMDTTDKQKMIADLIWAFEGARKYFLERGYPDLAAQAQRDMAMHIKTHLSRL